MKASLTTPPTTDPAQLLRYRDRQYAAELIATGLMHFDFFTWLSNNDGAQTSEILEHFEFSPRPADVFLTLCRANRFIETDPESDQNRLTALGREHLVSGSPWYLGPYYAPIADTQMVQDFAKILRTGKPANWQAKDDGSDWHESMKDPEFAQSFTDLMNCRGLALGQALAEKTGSLMDDRTHLLDVGGGSGIYSSTMVARHPHLKATVLEQPPVDKIVVKEITNNGLEGKIGVASGDMFSVSWPTDADALLFSNVLHDWDFPEVETLIAAASEALPKGGLLIIHDVFINDQKDGPLPAAEYSALLMSITQGKCYSPAEYGIVLEKFSFEPGPYVETVADRGFMTAVKR